MRFAAITTRLVGLWILTGAVLKGLHGSPADLPQVVRELPLALGATFKLMVGIELVIGLLVLLRPSKGWVPALLLLAAFLVVLVLQVVDGAPSCGCFGAALVIAPGVMLAIDGALTLLLVLSRPWRTGFWPREAAWRVVATVAVLSLALPVLVDREATPDSPTGPGGLKGYAELELDAMLGKKLVATRLHGWLGEEQRIEDGIIVIWRASCEVCADHLEQLANEEDGERAIVLLEVPKEFEDEKSVIRRIPNGAWVHESRLPDTVIWDLTPPVHIEVEAGVVTKMLEGTDVLD